MFTGLIESTGTLVAREPKGDGYRLKVACSIGPFDLGESVAVSGVCLTVVDPSTEGFSADISVETAQKTNLGQLPVGGEVNLERSLRLGDRMGGHLVTGHVDGVAEALSIRRADDCVHAQIRVPSELARYVATKGSVALDGTSLTVNNVSGNEFEIMLIPHTLQITNLKHLGVGTRLNVEVDLMARYMIRYLEATPASDLPVDWLGGNR